MEFLDKIGLKKFWTKIKTNFGTSVFRTSEGSLDRYEKRTIQFVTNHQVVNIDSKGEANQEIINLFEWFKNASIGGIIEIIPTTDVICAICCDEYYDDPNNVDSIGHIYKMVKGTDGTILELQNSVSAGYNTYLRLIKIDNNKLVVACKIN